ncbi:dynein intermediate chain 3, ciliary-like [Convolutriloba macropyga]|uniref:dynein intermediate chain 3, ciliary-like n=1 Tax=Convolutriloba macropyga TaxID=536237 RepID=UPI003F521AAF
MSEIDYLAKRPEVTQKLNKAIKEQEQKKAERAQGVRGGGGGEDDESGEEVSGEATEQEVALFVDIGVMALKDVKDVEMQTANPPLLQKGMLHYEGGWPKEIDVTDDEQKQRYCKKLEKEEGYTQTILGLCDTMETTILQNSAIDIYEEYFEGCEGLGGEDVSSGEAGGKGGGDRMLKVKSEFKDQHDRPALDISIQKQQQQERFAVAYGPYYYQQPIKSHDSLIWNMTSSSSPEQTLNCYSPAVSVDFHSRENSLLCCGFRNGTVGCYDLRKGPDCICTTDVSVSHKDFVTRASWINSKTHSELFSAGEDGCVKWWDIRNMAQPTDFAYCDPTRRNEPQNALVVSCLDVKFIVAGSE